MELANLIHMANRIGDFYESMPNPDEAMADIANHIHKFWAPRMRLALLSELDHESTDGLHALVKAALLRQRAVLMPKPLLPTPPTPSAPSAPSAPPTLSSPPAAN